MKLEDEKRLIARAQKDPEIFGELFDEYYRTIFGYVLRRVLDFDVAKDITSDVFFKAYKSLWSFRWRGVSISAWFYRIATNEINYYFRRKSRSPDSLDKLLEENGYDLITSEAMFAEKIEVEEKLQNYQDFLLIQSRLKLLPVKYQEVIALRYFESRRVAEISEILNKREGTVKSLLSRGLEKLRKLM